MSLGDRLTLGIKPVRQRASSASSLLQKYLLRTVGVKMLLYTAFYSYYMLYSHTAFFIPPRTSSQGEKASVLLLRACFPMLTIHSPNETHEILAAFAYVILYRCQQCNIKLLTRLMSKCLFMILLRHSYFERRSHKSKSVRSRVFKPVG